MMSLFFPYFTSVSSPILTTIPIARPLAIVVDMKAFPLQSPIGMRLVCTKQVRQKKMRQCGFTYSGLN